MNKSIRSTFLVCSLVVLSFVLSVLIVGATEETSPVKALADRDVYYPGTEDLAPDEMRVIACGTGMPNARPKQAAACWLVELANGDKFIFDIGTGSAERLSAMKIPYDYLGKVFIGHLHSEETVHLLAAGHTARSAEKTANSKLFTFHLFLNFILFLYLFEESN